MNYQYLFLILWFYSLQATLLGDRTANPAYIRILKTYAQPSIPTQQTPSRALTQTAGSMHLRSIMQPSDTELQTYQPITQTQESILSPREKEIAGFSHMYGTSDTYGDIELK